MFILKSLRRSGEMSFFKKRFTKIVPEAHCILVFNGKNGNSRLWLIYTLPMCDAFLCSGRNSRFRPGIYLSNIMSYQSLWPDFTLRHDDPVYLARPTAELKKIIRALMELNQSGQYSAFYEYNAWIGLFQIRIYKGRLSLNKTVEPVACYCIDCRDDPLSDCDTEQPIYAETFIEKMSLDIE